MKFTESRINSLPTPAKTKEYTDDGQVGLMLRVTPKGKKHFYFKKWNPYTKRVEKQKIGPTSCVPLKHARAICQQRTLSMLGSPLIQNPAVQSTLTLKEGCARYLHEHIVPNRTQKTQENTCSLLNRHIMPDSLARALMEDITHKELLGLHEYTALTAGVPTANQLISLLRAVFNYCLREELISCTNPAIRALKTIKDNPAYIEHPRTRILNPEEVQQLLDYSIVQDTQASRILMIALYTGLRKQSVLSIRWENVQILSAYSPIIARCEIDATHMKGGRSNHVVFFPWDSVFQAASFCPWKGPGGRPTRGWMFPGAKPDTHIVKPDRTIKKTLRDAGLPDDITMHTLRHTFVSWAITRANINPSVVAKMAGHSLPGITNRIYSHVEEKQALEGFREYARCLNQRRTLPYFD